MTSRPRLPSPTSQRYQTQTCTPVHPLRSSPLVTTCAPAPRHFKMCHTGASPRRMAPTELLGGETDDGGCRARRRHGQSSGYVHGRDRTKHVARQPRRRRRADEPSETVGRSCGHDGRRQASSRHTHGPTDIPEGARDRDGKVRVETACREYWQGR